MPDLDGTIALIIEEATGVGHPYAPQVQAHSTAASPVALSMYCPVLVTWWCSQVPPESDAHVRRSNAS